MTTSCLRVGELAPGFVLGALEPSEMAAVRDHLASCEKPHPELEELGGVVPYLAITLDPVEPPESIKAAILAAAEADLTARRRSDAAAERLIATLGGPRREAGRVAPTAEPVVGPAREAAAPAARQPAAGPAPEPAPAAPEPAAEPDVLAPAALAPTAQVVPFRPSRSRRILRWGVSVAAAVVILVGAGLVIPRGGALAPSSNQPSDVLPRLNELDWMVTLDPASGTNAGGHVYHRKTGNVVVQLDGLQPTTGAQVYEIWVISDNGQPTPVAGGSSEGTALYVISTPVMDTAKQIIVTLEPAGKPSVPTLPAIVTAKLPN